MVLNITPDWAALLPLLVLVGVGALLPVIGAFDGSGPSTSRGGRRGGARVRAGWLAGFPKTRIASSEASMKYFLIGSISSALAIFGISLVYGLTGSVTFDALGSLWGGTLRLADGSTTTIAFQLFSGRFTMGVFVWM